MQAAATALRTATTLGAAEIADLLETTRDLACHLLPCSLSREDWLRSVGATTVTLLARRSRYGLAGWVGTPCRMSQMPKAQTWTDGQQAGTVGFAYRC